MQLLQSALHGRHTSLDVIYRDVEQQIHPPLKTERDCEIDARESAMNLAMAARVTSHVSLTVRTSSSQRDHLAT